MKRPLVWIAIALSSALSPLVVPAPLALAANVVVGGPPPALQVAPTTDAASDLTRRDLAEQVLRALSEGWGKDPDPRYRAELMRDLLALPLNELERLASPAVLARPETLGSPLNDLVYTPLTPCRIFDSRPGSGVQGAGTGPLAPGTPVSLDVAGGAAASCAVPFPAAKAAVLNIIAVSPAGAGNLRAWPWDLANPPPPNASVINYSNLPGLNIANGLLVPICNISTSTAGNCSDDLFLRADVSSTHVVIDVFGYLAAPVETALACTRVSTPFSVPVNAQLNAGSGTCPAGTTLTGGGIEYLVADVGGVGARLLGSNPFANVWQCAGYNGGSVAWTGNCWAICCTVPAGQGLAGAVVVRARRLRNCPRP